MRRASTMIQTASSSQRAGGRFCRTTIGLSLLEVILALAILAIASAYLAQSMELATHNALRAERLTQAELVAESVMNQVIAGVIPSKPVTWTNYHNSAGMTEWLYELRSVPTEIEGMVGLQVAVQKSDPNVGLVATQADLFANRWIIDPALELDVPPEPSEEEAASDSSSGAPSSSGQNSSSGSSTAANPAANTAGGSAFGGAPMGAMGGGLGGAQGAAGGRGAGSAGSGRGAAQGAARGAAGGRSGAGGAGNGGFGGATGSGRGGAGGGFGGATGSGRGGAGGGFGGATDSGRGGAGGGAGFGPGGAGFGPGRSSGGGRR